MNLLPLAQMQTDSRTEEVVGAAAILVAVFAVYVAYRLSHHFSWTSRERRRYMRGAVNPAKGACPSCSRPLTKNMRGACPECGGKAGRG